MAYKFKIETNAIEVLDTVSSEVLIFQPARDTWFEEESLDVGYIKLYGTTSTNEDNIKKYSRFDNDFRGFLLSECVDNSDTPFTAETFRTFCSVELGKSSASSSGALSQNFGFVDYNDNTGSIALVADTWTDVPNNKQGAFTNTAYAPNGLTSLMDGNTGYLDFSELTLGSDVLIRIDFSVIPNTNNSLLETRYVLGQGVGEYNLPVRARRLDSGSGISYASEKGSFYIYMGDNNTLGGVGKLQVRLSTTGTLTNAGVAIKIYKK